MSKTLLEPPRTLTRERIGWPKRADPSLEPSMDDGCAIDHNQRIVVVTPFSSFNFLFEHTAKKISDKVKVDVVSEAAFREEPYLDVAGRERQQESMPNCIVDFCRIGVRYDDSLRMQRFTGYLQWAIETVPTMKGLRTRYLIPHRDGELSGRISGYEVGRPFDPYTFPVRDLNGRLAEDIARIVHGDDEGFEFFSEIVPNDQI